MSVITPLSRQQIETFLLEYPQLGELTEFTPTLSGIENTNYFLDLKRPDQIDQRCVLTLFEQLSEQQLPFYNELLLELAERSLPVPAPIVNKRGETLGHIQNKPVILAPCFKGRHPNQVSVEQCREMGTFLGRMHQITVSSHATQANPKNLRWMESSLDYLGPYLNSANQQLLKSELKTYKLAESRFNKLPAGIVHADLFRDNALFDCDKLTGVIDFYSACSAPLLYDLAVVANDWCHMNGKFDSALTAALLQAYELERVLGQNEREIWPMMLRFAACRFWISRLLGCHPVVPNKPSKDPQEFRQILMQRIASIS